jgi:hypothetical protein
MEEARKIKTHGSNLTFGIFLLTPPDLDALQRALQFLLV